MQGTRLALFSLGLVFFGCVTHCNEDELLWQCSWLTSTACSEAGISTCSENCSFSSPEMRYLMSSKNKDLQDPKLVYFRPQVKFNFGRPFTTQKLKHLTQQSSCIGSQICHCNILQPCLRRQHPASFSICLLRLLINWWSSCRNCSENLQTLILQAAKHWAISQTPKPRHTVHLQWWGSENDLSNLTMNTEGKCQKKKKS